MAEARGLFDVKLILQEPDNSEIEATGLATNVMQKEFEGDLKATSRGEMLSLLNREIGSGGYVALERVTGTLDGRSGSFVLQHSATMKRGVPELKIAVVPDSGTGELKGLTGSMTIEVQEKQHFYYFNYAIEEPGGSQIA